MCDSDSRRHKRIKIMRLGRSKSSTSPKPQRACAAGNHVGENHVTGNHLTGNYMDKEREKALREAFQMFDLDGNGTISVKEMLTCLHAMGRREYTYDDVLQKFQRIDKDGNYEVDFEEFKAMMMS